MKAPMPAYVAEWRNDTYDAIDPTRPELSQKGQSVVSKFAFMSTSSASLPTSIPLLLCPLQFSS